MNLRGVDLNLLVILDALLDEAHVSRAAERVGLSQPAASSALERCRQLFGDRLLERGAGGMVLTPRAQALAQPVKDVLAGMAVLLEPRRPDLGAIRQTVRVLMSDQPAAAIAPALQAQLARTAPGITLAIMPWHGADAALEGLARGAIDLAVSVFPMVEADFTRKELFRERYLVALRQHHPALDGFDLDRWLAFPHVLVSGRGETQGALDEALARLGRTRRIGFVVPSFLMVPPLLAGSDLIALLPSRCLPPATRADLVALPPPIPVEGFPLHIAWHRRRGSDAGVQHVAGLVESLIGGLETWDGAAA
ncbi:LysR family transcriptional regulator [Bosea lathyri]|uniref:DNA-binding transcriptional regulator, LysR family n=1 Tax=Bosea lathyri TaxID=1036778 RepID=A0A1H5TNP9_9HYPH|nr:LysR substrate-binding domain-containing protein [Bosea lathyri]SEF64400.1 DNA-binding transcriptional regulator, LysR family [Bosea lathyri]